MLSEAGATLRGRDAADDRRIYKLGMAQIGQSDLALGWRLAFV